MRWSPSSAGHRAVAWGHAPTDMAHHAPVTSPASISRRLVLALVLALAPGLPGVGASAGPATIDDPGCSAAFSLVRAISVALAAVDPVADPPVTPHDAVRTSLLDATISACAGRDAWLAAAAAHPELLGDLDPATTLEARCGDPSGGLAARPTCAAATAPEARLVARPSVRPRVTGADRTRYYPIRGLSPDELFTQMQLNGSAGCPTHALACVNIQPIIRPFVSTGSSCRVLDIQASLQIEAVLPRWAGPRRVYPELAAWWRTVAARIGRHETEHIRIAERHLARLRRDIIGRSCSTLNAFVQRWSMGLTQAQTAFDRREARRPWPDYDGPLP